MYVSVVIVMSCFYSAVSLALVREQSFLKKKNFFFFLLRPGWRWRWTHEHQSRQMREGPWLRMSVLNLMTQLKAAPTLQRCCSTGRLGQIGAGSSTTSSHIPSNKSMTRNSDVSAMDWWLAPQMSVKRCTFISVSCFLLSAREWKCKNISVFVFS